MAEQGNRTMTVKEMLITDVRKLGEIRVPMSEYAIGAAIAEVMHDIRSCVAAIESAEAARPGAAEAEDGDA